MVVLRRLLVLAALLLTPFVSLGQGFNGGILYASDFNNWNLPQGTGPAMGSIAWQDQTICKVGSAGYNFVAPKVGRPLLIVDVNPAMSETVVPTQVIVGPQGCSLNAPMVHQHFTYTVRSGTDGLQEAIDYNAGKWFGALVFFTRQWTEQGGVDSMLPGLTGNNSVWLVDERTNCPVPYTWTGSAYAAGPDWCSGGGGGGPTLRTNNTLNLLQSDLNLLNTPTITVTNISAGNVTIACNTATTSVLGCVRADNSTITNAGGVLTAVNQGLNSFTSGPFDPFFTTSLGSDPTHNPALAFTAESNPTFTFPGNFTGGSAPWAAWTLVQGANITLTSNVGAKTLTIASTGGSGGCTTLGGVNQPQGANGSGGCVGITTQVDGVNLTTPLLPNFIDGLNTTVVNPASNQVRIDVTAPPVALQMAPVPPVPGQFVVLFPTSRSGVSGTAGFCPDQGNWNMIINGAGGLVLGANCNQTISGPWKTAQGQTLASLGIATGSVTAVYVFGITSVFPGYFDDGSGPVLASKTLTCSGVPVIPSLTEYSTQQVTGLTGLSGSGIAAATCTENMTRNSSIGNTASTSIMDVPSLGMIAYYSGTPAVQGPVINVAPPLTYDPNTMTLGLGQLFPQIVFPDTVAALPSALANVGAEANVTDSTSAFACTTGGGVNFVTCVATPSGWVAKQSVTAALESINLFGGGVDSIPYQSAPNTTAFSTVPTTLGHTYAMGWVPSAQPQIVQATSCQHNCAFKSPVTSGDLLVAITIDNNPSPTGCSVSDTFSTTFTLQQSAVNARSYTGVMGSSGTDTVTASNGGCNLMIVEVSGQNATAVDVAGTIVGTTGASISPSVTTVTANDTIIMWQGYEGQGTTATATNSLSSTFRAGTGLGPVKDPYNVWSLPAASATTYSSTMTISPTGHIFAAGMLALKAGSGGPIAPGPIDLTATVAGVASLNSLTGALNLTSTGGTITITPSGSTINLEATGGGGSGITGATSGQALIAGSPTTATSSKALAGAGAGLVTGPLTSILHDCAWFADTSGTLADSGSPCGSGGGLSGMVAGQIPVAASPTTVTSSMPLGGAGAGITTGPISGTTIGDCSVFTTTTGQIGDAGPCPGGGGSGAIVASAEVVSFSATPTFSTAFNVSRIVLTGNVTTFTLGAGLDGQTKTLCFKQGTGPWTVAGPANVHGFFIIGTTNAKWNCQTYVYDLTDSIWTAETVGVINE